LAEDDGLLAIGGDLSTERLLLAYNNGIFPWYGDDEPICWYAPHERCVIFPAKIYISSSMKKLIRQKIFTVTTDTVFDRVISNCKNIGRKDQPGTWITDEMETAYLKLHRAGIAHSVEVWQEGELAGGIYGLRINNIFCGESMFSRKPNASKAAMIWLCQSEQYSMIDCQIPNDHLISMGAEMISQQKYRQLLQQRTAFS
jgi:leucyl/phenylalanyl-tRNA--protein transferase